MQQCGCVWWLDLVNIPYAGPDSSMLVRPRTFGCLRKLSDCREKKNERVRQREEQRGRKEDLFLISVLSWSWSKWRSLIRKFSPIFLLFLSVDSKFLSAFPSNGSGFPLLFFCLLLWFSPLVNSHLSLSGCLILTCRFISPSPLPGCWSHVPSAF